MQDGRRKPCNRPLPLTVNLAIDPTPSGWKESQDISFLMSQKVCRHFQRQPPPLNFNFSCFNAFLCIAGLIAYLSSKKERPDAEILSLNVRAKTRDF